MRRAGASGRSCSAQTRGSVNHKMFKRLDAARAWSSRSGSSSQSTIRALIAVIGEPDWLTLEDYPDDRGGADRPDQARGPAADRPPHPPDRRPSRAVARLASSRVRDQPHRADARGRDADHREHADDRASDPRPQRPSPRALPLRPVPGEQRLDRDRRPRAQPARWTTLIGLPARPSRPPAPAAAGCFVPGRLTRTSPPMDTPNARPLALAKRLHSPSLDAIRALPALT